MTKTILEKMYFKPEYSSAILNLPSELTSEFSIVTSSNTGLQKSNFFILAFYIKKHQLENDISNILNSLEQTGILWIAYPKNKLLDTDINRDILHEYLRGHKLDGVSIVSLNQVWSAMRFKRIK